MEFTGELAAVGAAIAFSGASTLFTLAARKLGAALTLRISIPLGAVLTGLLSLVTMGSVFPDHIEIERVVWLGMSGILGFWLSFTALMYAFVSIGPRLTLLIASINPVLSTLMAWIFLDQILEPRAISGIVLIVLGVGWVVGNNQSNMDASQPVTYRSGVLLAMLASFMQSVSYLFSSQGVAGDFSPLTASLIRLIAATIAMWGFAAIRGTVRSSIQTAVQFPRSSQIVGIATLIGPVAAAALVLVSLQHTRVGIASTLIGLSPIFLIPIGYIVFKERITIGAVIGTLIAVAGTALLFL